MKVIVTRHKSMIEYLINIGLIDSGDLVLEHASPEDVEGKDVIGVLPLSLACLASSITEIPLKTPRSLRGYELTLKDIEELADRPVKYVVRKA